MHEQEAIRVIDRRAVGADLAAATGAEAAQGQSRLPVGIEPGVFGGHLVGVADRHSVASSPRQVSLARDLLAALEAVGRAGCMTRRVASAAGRAGRRRLAEVGGDVPGRQLRPGENGALRLVKPSAARVLNTRFTFARARNR